MKTKGVNHRVMPPKIVDGKANSVGPDQIAPVTPVPEGVSVNMRGPEKCVP